MMSMTHKHKMWIKDVLISSFFSVNLNSMQRAQVRYFVCINYLLGVCIIYLPTYVCKQLVIEIRCVTHYKSIQLSLKLFSYTATHHTLTLTGS